MDRLPELRRTLADLVAFDTTSVRSNLPLIDYLEPRMRAAGFDCQRAPYLDEAGVEKANLLCRKGPSDSGRAELALVGHTDCVPYDAKWTDALTLTERDGKLYGRGACDAKAQIACIVAAAERAPSNLRRPLLAIFSADEEIGCVGAKRLVDAGLGRARFAIVGEPTSLTPIRANKGYFLAEVEVFGKEGHSAYPELGASAIFRAARLLKRLEEVSVQVLRLDADPKFDPPYTSVNVGVIQGGKAKNVIAGSCKFILEWRPIPRQRPEHTLELVREVLAELTRAESGYQAEVRVLRGDAGVETPESSEVVSFLVGQSGNAPATVAFGTEAPQLTQLGAEAVVFGAGDIRVAHQTGEFVPMAELQRSSEILSAAIERFCAR